MKTTLLTAILALLLAGSPAFAGEASAPAGPPAPEPALMTPATTPAAPTGGCQSALPEFLRASQDDDDLSPILGPVCQCLADSDCCAGSVCMDADYCGRCVPSC